VAPNGRRCTERAFLEFHHREPYAIGGEATTANISLRCRRHNAYEAELAFGSTVRITPGVSLGCVLPTGDSPAVRHPVMQQPAMQHPAVRHPGAGQGDSPRGELDTS